MNRKIMIAAAALGMLGLVGIAAAVITSYGSITGAATVKPAISWDILETYSDVNTTATNDTQYVLETTYQAETKWVKIKIENDADTDIPVNVTITGDTDGIALSVWDINKSAQLSNPITVPPSDIYIWLRHDIAANASPGSYSFEISFMPA